jgi:hypothetical protein
MYFVVANIRLLISLSISNSFPSAMHSAIEPWQWFEFLFGTQLKLWSTLALVEEEIMIMAMINM